MSADRIAGADPDTIPAELRHLRQWVNWNAEKKPLTPGTDHGAKANDPSTWGTLQEALAADPHHIGFEVTEPYTFVDLDHCRDPETGEVSPEAQEILDRFDTYKAVSSSGTGLQMLCRGQIPAGSRTQADIYSCGVEVYSRKRFMAWTGDRYGDHAEINDCQAVLEELHGEVTKAAKKAGQNGGAKLGAGQGRNNELTRRLGLAVASGVTGDALRARAHDLNDFDPPLGGDEVEKVLRSAEAWPPGDGVPLVLEAAHAEVLANEWRDQYRWAAHESTWRRWTGRVWERADEAVVVNAAQKILRRHYGHELAQRQTAAEDKRLHELHKATCRYASVLGALAFLRGEPGFHTEFGEWDADPYALNCGDGLLDLRTQTLRPHDPAALCTKIVHWSYASTASTGAWERHLRRWLPDDDVRRQVQRDLGRALAGTDLEESLPIWYGTGANGKSTTTRTLLQGVDKYGKQAVKDLLVASKFERHTTELADLAGSRIVIAEEVQDGKHLDEATVKNLTGGNRKKARFMRGDNFEFEQTFSIFLLVNHRPVIIGTDKGIWRRLRLVPWTVSITFADQRPQDEVVDELMADGSWMLRWMVAGFADWQADHHWIAEAVEVATAAYRAEQDVLAGFLSRCCALNPEATVSVNDLYEAYTIDTMENGDEGVERLTKIVFSNRLKSRNLMQGRDTSGSRRIWLGIGLLTSSDKNAFSST
jgi:putative DNA primase/helicase